MVTVISRFRVRNGLEEEVRRAFVNRPRLVEKSAGFCGLDVLTDAADPSVFLLLTRWTDEESFRVWHRSDAHHQSHGLMPRGLKLDAAFTSLTVGSRVANPDGAQNLNDALEGRTVALSHWLMESELLSALLLAPDGTIRLRNRAACRVFPPGPAQGSGCTVWDYLKSPDIGKLRQRLSGSEPGNEAPIVVNLAGEGLTVGIELVPSNGAILLLATQVQSGTVG